ncbi:MAG TPA: hypothetical protein VGY55_19800 [Pirellulales bacterium]|nr:hypothetical protein [Pirellulales bacterium]
MPLFADLPFVLSLSFFSPCFFSPSDFFPSSFSAFSLFSAFSPLSEDFFSTCDFFWASLSPSSSAKLGRAAQNATPTIAAMRIRHIRASLPAKEENAVRATRRRCRESAYLG